MTTKDLAKLGVFLLGLFMLPQAIESLLALPLYLESLREIDDPAGREMYLFTLALAFTRIAFTISLVFAASWWAGLTFGGNRELELSRLSSVALEELFFGITGLVLITLAVVQMPAVLISWLASPESFFDPGQTRREYVQKLQMCAGPLVQTGIGLWLLLGSRGLVALWRRLRAAGHVKHPTQT